MAKLIITRGLPAAGKSTWARAWVAEDPQRRARVNRDDLRAMAHKSVHLKPGDGGDGTERAIMAGRDALIFTWLKRGVDVVNDDTNLPLRTVRDLRRVAELAGAEFQVIDMTDVHLEDCRTRNGLRDNPVPDAVILDMHRRYISKQPYPLPIPDEPETDDKFLIEPYKAPMTGRGTWIVDIDGTLALMGTRSPFDETRVHEDQPNPPVVRLVNQLWMQGDGIIFMSGRKESCRKETEEWLRDHFPFLQTYPLRLFMRPATGPLAGETDWKVKLHLFNEHVRQDCNVVGVLDDRDQVVEMWRKLGLTCLQVAPGAF